MRFGKESMRSFRKVLRASASALVPLALGLWTYDIRVIQPHRADIEEILNTATRRTASLPPRSGPVSSATTPGYP